MMVAACFLISCGQAQAPHTRVSSTPIVVRPEDPCSLLTPDQVADAAGIEVSEEREGESKGSKDSLPFCLYKTASPYNFIIVVVEAPITEEAFRKRMERDLLNSKVVDDVGDLAFLHAGASISTLADSTAISMSVQSFGSVQSAEVVLREVAKAAVSAVLPQSAAQ
jgi:hypothetical protein